MINIKFTPEIESYNKDNTEYFLEAKIASQSLRRLIENEYEEGSITLHLAIPHKFFYVEEISSEIDNTFHKFVEKKIPNDLKSWII